MRAVLIWLLWMGISLWLLATGLGLTSCQVRPRLYPRVLHLTPEAAYIYDTLLRTSDDDTVLIPDRRE